MEHLAPPRICCKQTLRINKASYGEIICPAKPPANLFTATKENQSEETVKPESEETNAKDETLAEDEPEQTKEAEIKAKATDDEREPSEIGKEKDEKDKAE